MGGKNVIFRNIIIVLLFTLFCLPMFITCTENQQLLLTLVKNGKPNYVILVNPDILPLNKETNIISISEREVEAVDALSEQRNALNELLYYVKKISGAELQVEPAKEGKEGCYIGLSSNFPWLNFTLEDTGNEGFQIGKKGKSMFVIANNPIGIRHAINTILMESGCRWFFPGEEWEEIPNNKTIKVTPAKQTPAFDVGRTIWYGFGSYNKQGKDKKTWDYHNKMGSIAPVNIGHTNYGLDFDKDFELHPEWFALVEGRRKASKVCYSHPEVIQRITEYALTQAKNGATSVSLSPADGLGFCECDLCFGTAQGGEIIKDKGTFFATRPDSVFVCTVSETLFNAVNIAAKAIGEKYPDVIIGCYGYSGYSQPPSFKLEPNIFVQTTTHFRRTPLTLEEQLKLWGQVCNHVGIRGYWSVYQWDWDNPLVGEFIPEMIQKNLQFYKDNNAEAFSTEACNNWGPRGLSYYIGSKLLWDINVNIKDIIKDFYEKAFGPAAEPIQRYYSIWYGPSVTVLNTHSSEEQVNSVDSLNIDEFGAYSPRVGLATKDDLRLAFKALDDASNSVQNLPKYQKRVDQLRMYMYYILLRNKVRDSTIVRTDEELIEAIKKETTFGAQLTNTNMIHTKPLLGKAFMRLFREYELILKDIQESQKSESGWREPINTPPTHEELNVLWEEGKRYLDLN